MSERRRSARVAAVASVLLTASLVVFNVLLSVHLMALDLGFYRAKWLEYRVTDDTGMTIDELTRSGRALLDYFIGKAGTPQLAVTVDGHARSLYNETELTHLRDVKSLFGAGFTLEQVLAAEIAGVGLYLSKAGNKRLLARSFSIAAGISVGLLIALAIPAKLDFGAWWTDFHLVTFSNDLWQLDPATDWLIRMFPEGFFSSAVQRIGLYSAGTAAAYACSGFLVRHFSADHRH